MSHMLYWPGQTFFYPLGNTSAVCLTENLPPEHNADVLLLGCGDPRHILYTVYADATLSGAVPRKLDVTCCDMEAAVLARNTLLFTLLADNGAEKRLSSIWNIFYHMMLDKDSLSLLIEQCRKLVPLAQDMKTWKQGPYSLAITMCNDATLSDIRRFWKLWLGTARFNERQAKRFTKDFQDGLKNIHPHTKEYFVITSMRSAGPLAPVTLKAATDQFKRFWTSGVTDDGSQAAKPATNANPTFAFSSSGDKVAVHYGTDPILGFHLAETLASSGCALSDESAAIVFKMVQAARHQFNAWCKAVIGRIQHTSASSASLVVRMYAGEALAFCQALHSIGISPQPHTPTFVAPWKRSVVQLDKTAYGLHALSPAPTSFNVIETSNLLDHLGLHNLLLVTAPLLRHSLSSTLYTEALLTPGESATKGILAHMCGDPATISLLLGVVPSTYVSHFTTRSNMSDTLMRDMQAGGLKTQCHERLAWKSVDHGYAAEPSWKESIRFAPEQLAKTLFEIYLQMFSNENLSKRLHIMHLSKDEKLHRIRSSGLLHYTRRSFALLLAHVQKRIQCDWDKVVLILEGLVLGDRTLITGSNFYQELACHLHLAGFTIPWLSPAMRDIYTREDPPIFRDWSTVPQVVTVVLVVPRHVITNVQSELSAVGTPILQCEVRSGITHNAFACISASFGKLTVSGRGENKTAVITEDSAGTHGSFPIVVSFPILVPILILTSGGTVGLAVRSTMSTTPLMMKLGMGLGIFKALLTDERYVHILAKAPTTNNSAADGAAPPITHGGSDGAVEHYPIHVEMDGSNSRVQSLTSHIDITDAAEQVSLVGRCDVRTTQLSANQVILHIEKHQRIVAFPLPVDAPNAKLRVARESKYVEIVAPITLTSDVHGERNITKYFRMSNDSGTPTLWNVHYLKLDLCPSFKLSKDPKAFDWFVPHVSHMVSHRERRARASRQVVPGVVHDTFLNIKDSLHILFCAAAGLEIGQTHTEFALRNRATDEIYAIIIITDLRLDLAAHTIVADSWVIPGSDDIRNKLGDELSTMLSIKTDSDESEAWTYLLSLFIERCRVWEHKTNCEYLARNSASFDSGAGSDPKNALYCSCGMGVGTEVLRRCYGDAVATYATRAAISPLFSVSYLEEVGASAPRLRCSTLICTSLFIAILSYLLLYALR